MKRLFLSLIALLCASLAGVAQTANETIWSRYEVDQCPKNPQLASYLKRTVKNVTVARGADPSLNQEAVRVIKAMPKWIPGKHLGMAVRVKYTLPIKFRLPDPEPPKKQQ